LDYALDTRTGDKVFPSGAMRHRRYLCPCCKKEVTVRSIDRLSRRAPHFAHLKGRADINCENFFASISSQLPVAKKFQQLIPKTLEFNFDSTTYDGFSKGFYLILQEDEVQLFFQFRVKSARSDWTGQIEVDSLDGVKFFAANTIVGKHVFPVDIGFTEENIKRIGSVDEEIWRLLSFDMTKVSGNMEFFHAPYSNGRMLGEHEAIVLGEVYVVSSKSSLNKNVIISPMIEAVWKIREIDLFQIRLPNSLPEEDRTSLEEIFARKISLRRPAFKLLDPLPHFIELDGTVRISKSTNLIVLSFDCEPNEIEYAILGGISGLDTVEFNQNLLLVDVADSRGVEIYWQKSMMIRIEKGRIPEILTSGVAVYSSGIAHNMLDSVSMRSIPLNAEFYLDCPLADVEKNILVNKELSLLGVAKNGQIFLSENGVSVDAGSFGFFEFIDSVLPKTNAHENSTAPVEKDPVERWIKSLSLLDEGINSYFNSGFKAENSSKALEMARNHLRDMNLRKNSKGVIK
jgi:hypothetical protein